MDLLTQFFEKAIQAVLKALPLSPFKPFIDSFALENGVRLGWINWIVPIGPMLKVMSAWLAAVALFYMYSIIARWVKLIGD